MVSYPHPNSDFNPLCDARLTLIVMYSRRGGCMPPHGLPSVMPPHPSPPSTSTAVDRYFYLYLYGPLPLPLPLPLPQKGYDLGIV